MKRRREVVLRLGWHRGCTHLRCKARSEVARCLGCGSCRFLVSSGESAHNLSRWSVGFPLKQRKYQQKSQKFSNLILTLSAHYEASEQRGVAQAFKERLHLLRRLLWRLFWLSEVELLIWLNSSCGSHLTWRQWNCSKEFSVIKKCSWKRSKVQFTCCWRCLSARVGHLPVTFPDECVLVDVIAVDTFEATQFGTGLRWCWNKKMSTVTSR